MKGLFSLRNAVDYDLVLQHPDIGGLLHLMSRRVPILVYHHVYPDDNPELAIKTDKMASGVIGVSEFRRQMGYVHRKRMAGRLHDRDRGLAGGGG